MPKLPWRLSVLVQTFADDLLIAEALLFPGVACLQADRTRLRTMLVKRLREQIRQLPPGRAYRHRLADAPAIEQLVVEVPPLRGDHHRRSSVTLTLHYVQWRQRSDAYIAYFPALQIEVLSADPQELSELLLPQVRSALARQKSAAHLRNLVLLDQYRGLEVRSLRLKVKTPTLKEAAISARDRQEQRKSILKEVATDLAKELLPPAYEREHELRRLTELLTGPMPRSVLLVGRSGVGKTALVRELARQQRSVPEAFALWSTS
ncbi:MAG TPA: AAA family ATPase, partial [Pirellulaceae bacterium]|nr:AAA family ATPase [Pirellulaceae bacterium]